VAKRKNELRKSKSVLILMFSDLSNQPRVFRQINYLNEYYNVTTAGFRKSDIADIDHINITIPTSKLFRDKIPAALLMIFKRHETCYWNFPIIQNGLKALSARNNSFDLIIAHDPIALPLALKLARKNNAKVLLDAHEYTPRQYEDHLKARILYNKFWDGICRIYLSQVDAVTTVCQGLADEYRKNYSIHCDVITNAPFYSDLKPSTTDKNSISLIYHGAVHPSRKTENMISLMDHLDNRFHLYLMLVEGKKSYHRRICDMAGRHPRITVRDTVPMPDIAENINKYDIGLFLLSPETFSYRMALPNKLFEFIQGRLAIAIWPSPEMAKIVKEHDCGIVAKDFSIMSMATMLNNLSTQQIDLYKKNSHIAASKLCAEENRERFLAVIQSLL
jgi:glycosyltransferase involved in cell wall biosynthesis